jgi:hypothetical protein
MVGAGGSYAVATLGPDAATLPTREVVEVVQPLPFAVTDMAPQALRLYRSEITRSNDTAESLLRRLGISDSIAAAFIRNNPQARQALLGKAGRLVSAEADEHHQLLSLSARWARDDSPEFQRLVVARAWKAANSAPARVWRAA